MTADVAPEIVDRLMDFYRDWREPCLKMHGAHERFKVAAPADRDLACAAYDAALGAAKKEPVSCTPSRSGELPARCSD